MKKIDDFSPGQIESFEDILSEETIRAFAELSGDTNPLHSDAAFAVTHGFEGPVAYGMISALLFSKLVGILMPGPGALYLSQSFLFHRPLYRGMKLKVSAKVLHVAQKLNTLKLETSIADSATNMTLVTGEAVVKLLS